MPKEIQINEDWLQEKYLDEQLSKQQIANLLSCSYGCIHNKLVKFGIPIRSQQEALKIDANRPEKIEWARNKMLGENNIVYLPGVREKVGRNVAGDKNPMYGNFKEKPLSSLNSLIRSSKKYKKWRTKCFKRDDYTCQFCGSHGGELNVDHIKPFSVIVNENKIRSIQEAYKCKELWNKKNGRTLCVECHKATDTFGLGAKNFNDKTKKA